uniref:Uncharacterized protein n=1 Tax=viral metagenome TaxID=1070528 RepID=A0A6H1ZF32_9ZZZZ
MFDKYDERNWLLTDQEKERGGSQTAKNQAYIEAGGIIFNKDAFGDMYEALKQWDKYLSTSYPQNMIQKKHAYNLTEKALSKAEGRL